MKHSYFICIFTQCSFPLLFDIKTCLYFLRTQIQVQAFLRTQIQVQAILVWKKLPEPISDERHLSLNIVNGLQGNLTPLYEKCEV
jgi:hypothetical protein